LLGLLLWCFIHDGSGSGLNSTDWTASGEAAILKATKTKFNVERGKPQQQAVEVQNVGLAGVLVRRD
jgi:hypothetical protein